MKKKTMKTIWTSSTRTRLMEMTQEKRVMLVANGMAEGTRKSPKGLIHLMMIRSGEFDFGMTWIRAFRKSFHLNFLGG